MTPVISTFYALGLFFVPETRCVLGMMTESSSSHLLRLVSFSALFLDPRRSKQRYALLYSSQTPSESNPLCDIIILNSRRLKMNGELKTRQARDHRLE